MFADIDCPGNPRAWRARPHETGASSGSARLWWFPTFACGLTCLVVVACLFAAGEQSYAAGTATAVAPTDSDEAAVAVETEVGEEAPANADAQPEAEEATADGDQSEPEEASAATQESEPSADGSGESAEADDAASEDVEEDNGSHEEEDERPAETDEKPVTPDKPRKEKFIIGATARFQETQSGLVFNARIDTGAETCSLHVEEIQVENEVEGNMDDNIGKTIQFVIQNHRKERHLCKAKIVNVVRIANAYGIDRRYKVMLTFRCEDFDFEKRVEVSLNDRSHKTYPLLIGRNYLRGDFLVDVSLGKQDD